MVAPKVFFSNDAGAPTLNGLNGSLVTVLDACLVNGYGARAAAGWTKEYSGTNKAVYRMGAGGTADRMYLRVFDGSANTNRAFIKGYRTMSSVDAGTYPFPEFRQVPVDDGLVTFKSTAATGTNTSWAIIATPVAVWMFIEGATYLGANPMGINEPVTGFFFGEYEKYFVGHDQNVAIIGGNWAAAAQMYTTDFGKVLNPAGPTVDLSSAHYVARPPYGVEQSSLFMKTALSYAFFGAFSGSSIPIGLGGPSPNPSFVSGKILLSKVELATYGPSWELAGKMPGAHIALTRQWFQPNTVIDGVGDFAGQQFFVGHVSAGAGTTAYSGQILINLTDW